MRLLDKTLDTLAENLALDEALLEAAETGENGPEVLRIWESSQAAVILGRASRVAAEVDLAACRSRSIPVMRRASGGAAVMIGPGCLMYSVVLGYERRPQLRMVEQAHAAVLDIVASAVGERIPEVRRSGISDLSWGNRKFSGNSLRCKRRHFLYHGTLLCGFPLELIASCLRMPDRQPPYRAARPHAEFLVNLPVSREWLRESLIRHFGATRPMDSWPHARTQQLATGRYVDRDWIYAR